MAYLFLLITLVILILALRDPFVGLLGVLMLNILRPGEIYPLLGALHIERITAIVVLGSTVFHLRGFAVPKITKTVLAFWAAMVLAIPASYWISNAVASTIQFGQIIAYHLLIVTLVNNEQRFKTFLTVFSLLLGWLAGSSLYSYYTGSFVVTMGIERAVGLTSAGGDPNTLSNTLVSGIPLVLLLLTKDATKLQKLIGASVIVACLLTVINTGSRTGFFALIFLAGCFALTRKKNFIYVPVAIVLLGVTWTFIPQQYQERYLTVNKLGKDMSYQNRILAWKAGWAMFLDNPITGMGPGNFTYAAGGTYWPGEGRKIWLNAHSLPLKALGELGLLGTGAFAYMIVTLFKLNGSLKRRLAGTNVSSMLRQLPIACNFSLLVLLLTGYSSHNLYRNTWFMLAALSGALHLILKARERAQSTAAEATETPGGDPAEATPAYS